jgi:hypothetical protein
MRKEMQIVAQSENQPIAGIHAQRGSFAAIAVGIAVTDFAVIEEIAVGNVHLERAVLAAQILWLGDYGTGWGAGTDAPTRDVMRSGCGRERPGI